MYELFLQKLSCTVSSRNISGTFSVMLVKLHGEHWFCKPEIVGSIPPTSFGSFQDWIERTEVSNAEPASPSEVANQRSSGDLAETV